MTEVDRRNSIDLCEKGQTCWWQLSPNGTCYKLTEEEFKKANNITGDIIKPEQESKVKSKLIK